MVGGHQEDAGLPASVAEHRLSVEAADRDKGLVDGALGSFYTSELLMLLGRAVRQPNPKAAPKVDALR